MLKTESRRIGAFDYKVTQLDAVRGRRALTRLAKIVLGGASAGQSAATVQEAGSIALDKISDRLSEADVDYFCDLFAGNTTVSGGEYAGKEPDLAGIFALHFAGSYKEMFLWLAFALEVNFGAFFKGLGALQAKVAPADASLSTSPSTSTGTSGG